MKEFIDLGATTPPIEICAQVGSSDYYERARQEARAYIAQLRRVLGPEPPGIRFSIKSHPHDFGDYLTVVVHYDSDDAVASAYAERCDAGDIQEWDQQARIELNLPVTS